MQNANCAKLCDRVLEPGAQSTGADLRTGVCGGGGLWMVTPVPQPTGSLRLARVRTPGPSSGSTTRVLFRGWISPCLLAGPSPVGTLSH